MLGFMFGFNARLGRLHFLLASIGFLVALAVVFVAVSVVIPLIIPDQADVALRGLTILSLSLLLWANVMLQAMRLRDIGWDPVCVIPTWIVITILDQVVATKVPAWSLTTIHPGTAFGLLINVALGLALLFWPSRCGDDRTPNPRNDPASDHALPSRGRERTISVLESRVARLRGG